MKKFNFEMWGQALSVMPKITKEEWNELDFVSQWLISTRAAAIVMTFVSVGIAGLLAIRDGNFNLWMWLLVLVGLIMAHATNNLLNDYTDYVRGIDKDNYFREQYGPHPLGREFMTKRGLLTYAALNGLIALIAGLILVYTRGGLVLPLMIAGAVFVLFYTYPLKYIAMGEIVMLFTWGPLMVGGGYYVMSGMWDWNVALAGLAYSLGVTATLFGKHIDKLDLDKAKGVRTLPVVLGEKLARYVGIALFVLEFIVVLYLIITGYFSLLLLVVFITVPMFLKVVLPMWRHPRPAEPPDDYPEGAWPLWFVGSGFLFARQWGMVYLLGLILDLVYHLIFV
ncbi:MAG: prenyltransferase [Anaerolineaceae bacterium]|nr:prenyltransferase [Anaerolineaceae bacterium]